MYAHVLPGRLVIAVGKQIWLELYRDGKFEPRLIDFRAMPLYIKPVMMRSRKNASQAISLS